jgi:hypothetical protein
MPVASPTASNAMAVTATSSSTPAPVRRPRLIAAWVTERAAPSTTIVQLTASRPDPLLSG